ncbi:helix-turn-helix domain-containing protein [Candidatus Ferrigenium straubiae]|uniref:helix-turn-helix domain-containing protein n=1 Tax=Candidatus Ferrigenium straubiae TaxID=2919506 RepID=UPI003F4AF4BA
MNDCVINENDMARHVRKTLKEYFKDLDGEDPCCGIYGMVMDCVERPLLEMVLEHVGGNQSRAAEMLGINRNTLRKKMLQHGIA